MKRPKAKRVRAVGFDPLQCWRLTARELRVGATLKMGPYRKGVGLATVRDGTRLVVLTAARYNAICRLLHRPAKRKEKKHD